MNKSLDDYLLKRLRVVKDFPKKGIQFQDIFSLIENPDVLMKIVREMSKIIKKNGYNKIIGIEARGFIFGCLAAMHNKLPFIPIRKKGKLPGMIFKKKYKLEYGFDQIEINKKSILKGDKVLVIDDLIATGGTAEAAAKLIEISGGLVAGFIFVINLFDLPGEKLLKKKNYKVNSLINFPGH